MKQISTTKPLEVVVSRSGKGWLLTVNYNITEREASTATGLGENAQEVHGDGETAEHTTVWEYDSASVKCDKRPSEYYGTLVAAIIRTRFSADAVEAITQNYLADGEAGKAEFDELQAWRADAKRMAKALLGESE